MNQMQQGTFLYFAYGSNMLTERLHIRCPSARPLFNAIARRFSINFSKRSNDGSAKATLVRTAEQAAYGVLFEISKNELPGLDKAEGKGQGYDRDDAFMVVSAADGKESIAHTYRASPRACDKSLTPYDWYCALIVAGALQHGLPETYITELRKTIMRPDPEPQRPSRQEALNVLRCAGFHSLLEQ